MMTITQQLESCFNLNEARKLITLGNNLRPSGMTRRHWLKLWPLRSSREYRSLRAAAIAKGLGKAQRERKEI